MQNPALVPGARGLIWALGITVVALAGFGCASSEPKEAKLKTQLVASNDINPNRRGTAQPVKVHVFYLKQDEAFLQASFADLVNPNAPPIAADLLRRTESLIGPEETLVLDQKFDKATAFIGVVAEFTRIDDADWRTMTAVPPGKFTAKLNPFTSKALKISVEGVTVRSEIVKD